MLPNAHATNPSAALMLFYYTRSMLVSHDTRSSKIVSNSSLRKGTESISVPSASFVL